jgi:hypothetical protein
MRDILTPTRDRYSHSILICLPVSLLLWSCLFVVVPGVYDSWIPHSVKNTSRVASVHSQDVLLVASSARCENPFGFTISYPILNDTLLVYGVPPSPFLHPQHIR